MLPYYGKIGLYVFLLTVLGATTFISTVAADAGNVWLLLVSYYVVVNIIVFAVFSEYAYQIAVRAAFLGWVFAAGLCAVVTGGRSWAVFGLYVCFMAFFHWSEFVTIAATNPKTLSVDSFILNHSAAYGIAAVASWLEFAVEWYFFPTVKYDYFLPVTAVGSVLCAGGELLRKTAMLTARTSFTHVVQSVREDDHRLVTTGVYALCRHPSYVGWFYWSLGTQLVLVNPLCTVGYLVASWRFFDERVLVEEATLLTFFGEDYYEYQQKVPTGLPGIHGYKLSK